MSDLPALTFVDLETTGGSTRHDRIIEVGLVEVDEAGLREWSTLVDPGVRLSPFITTLTGISDSHLEGAPRFDQIAHELHRRLANRLFIAHNARFDQGFLKSEFRRLGLDFRPDVLCTVRLSRQLFPKFGRHNLDALVSRHRLDVSQRHRALGDARLLWQFWQIAQREAGAERLATLVRELSAQPTLPANLDGAVLDDLPNRAGVYLFYGENRLPLYIGKARRLRQRVLAHFSGATRDDREGELCRQIRHLEWIETGGELGALLQEAQLVKRLQPLYNRQLRQSALLCAWRVIVQDDHARIELAQGDDLFFEQDEELYGLYPNRATARRALRAIAEQAHLCPIVLGLEPGRPGRPCFGVQIERCQGACVGRETSRLHALRLVAALAPWRLKAWPFAHPIGIREGRAVHVLDGWTYLGTAHSADEMHAVAEARAAGFDRDVYRIVQPRLADMAGALIALPRAS